KDLSGVDLGGAIGAWPHRGQGADDCRDEQLRAVERVLVLQPLLVAEGAIQGAGNVCGPPPSCSSAGRPRRTTIDSACLSGSGSSFPRFSARRRIPAQAFGLKKYRGSIGPVSSIEDSEHAAAPLRHSEPLRVQHAPFDESSGTDRQA